MFGFGRGKETSFDPADMSVVELGIQVDVLERALQAMVVAGFPRAPLLETLRRVDVAVRSEVRTMAKKQGEPVPRASKDYSDIFRGV